MSSQLKKEFLKLEKKFLNGTASPAEIELLEQYYELFANEEEATSQLSEPEIARLEESLREGIAHRITANARPSIPFYKRTLTRAAAILVFASVGLYLVYKHYPSRPQPIVNNKIYKNDIAPGGNKAILTLADGSKLVLNNSKNGALATQAGIQIVKQDSTLSYKATTGNNGQASYNTITTPYGGQYQLVLADGTKVWLNAASSLRYPTSFTGKDRSVELTGEAYFEVAKNKNQPFNVKTATQTVQVLGTHFNVNAYSDEKAVKTTLLEGSVKVSSATANVMISPGQQSALAKNGLFVIDKDLDTDEIVAWKNGVFQFNEADIQTIMRQIARWYNIDVEFKGTIPANTYHGKISRNSNVSQVLKILELSGINFTIEGRKITVKS